MPLTPESALSPARVLLIGAGEDQQYWVRMALRDAALPHQLTVFPSAVAALDALRTEPQLFDVVLMNVKLPLLNIDEAVPAVRALPGMGAIGIVVFVIDASELTNVPEGCQTVILPGDPEELADAVRRAGAGKCEGTPQA